MVFAMVGTAVLSGMGTAYLTASKVQVHAVAENLARNQMEAIFSEPYQAPGQTPYLTIAVPANYSLSAATEYVPGAPGTDIEKVIVSVSHGGQDVLILTTLRFNE